MSRSADEDAIVQEALRDVGGRALYHARRMPDSCPWKSAFEKIAEATHASEEVIPERAVAEDDAPSPPPPA